MKQPRPACEERLYQRKFCRLTGRRPLYGDPGHPGTAVPGNGREAQIEPSIIDTDAKDPLEQAEITRLVENIEPLDYGLPLSLDIKNSQARRGDLGFHQVDGHQVVTPLQLEYIFYLP